MRRILTHGQEELKMLFKEVLDQMPPAEADRLASGYKHGQHIVMVLQESYHGANFKTAFSADLDMEVRMGSSTLESICPSRYLN